MSTRQKQIEAILAHELVEDVIVEAVINWTQGSFDEPDSAVKQVIMDYATAVSNKILDADTPFPTFATDWREQVSNHVYQTLDYKEFKKQQVPIVAKAIKPLLGDHTDDLEKGLWGYSLGKMANTVGCAAYMIANRLDPDLLRMSEEEANQSLLEMAQRLAEKDPNKVMVVDPEVDQPVDVAIKLQQRLLEQEDDSSETE